MPINHPYRTPAEMPKEKKVPYKMNENEMHVKIWKYITLSLVSTVMLIVGYNVFSTIENNRTAIIKSQIESTPAGKEAAQARYLEAKALADKAMFDQMAKNK